MSAHAFPRAYWLLRVADAKSSYSTMRSEGMLAVGKISHCATIFAKRRSGRFRDSNLELLI